MLFMVSGKIHVSDPNNLDSAIKGYLSLLKGEKEEIEKSTEDEIRKIIAKMYVDSAIRLVKELLEDEKRTIVDFANVVSITTLLRLCALANLTLDFGKAMFLTLFIYNALSSGVEE